MPRSTIVDRRPLTMQLTPYSLVIISSRPTNLSLTLMLNSLLQLFPCTDSTVSSWGPASLRNKIALEWNTSYRQHESTK